MKTLVVDDNKISSKLLKAVLGSKTNQVTLVEDGIAALKKLEQVEFDLVISDIQMPYMDGFTMILRIRSNIRLSHIPVILYSAIYTDINYEKMAIQFGANMFIRKMGSTEEIQAAVYEYAQRNHR